MLADEFWTIAEPGTAQTRVLGSRFSATAFPCTDEFVLQEFLERVKRKHYDASHHCWAMILRCESEPSEKCSDAGEPKGTAGLPILNEIRSRNLLDCAVVVTRWFGGTKLGTGGLVRSYGECAAFALDSAQKVRRRTGVTVVVSASFELQSHVYYLAGKYNVHVESEAASGGTQFRIRLRRSQLSEFEAALTEHSAGRLTLVVGEPWIS